MKEKRTPWSVLGREMFFMWDERQRMSELRRRGGRGCEQGGYVSFSGSLKICLVTKSLENDAVGSVGLLWPPEQASWEIAMEISSF